MNERMNDISTTAAANITKPGT